MKYIFQKFHILFCLAWAWLHKGKVPLSKKWLVGRIELVKHYEIHGNCNSIWAHQSLTKMSQKHGFGWKRKTQIGAMLLTVCSTLYWIKSIGSHETRRHAWPRGRHQVSVLNSMGKWRPTCIWQNMVVKFCDVYFFLTILPIGKMFFLGLFSPLKLENATKKCKMKQEF